MNLDQTINMRTFMNLFLVMKQKNYGVMIGMLDPAHGKPGPPELQYIKTVGVLNNTKVTLDLVQNSDYFSMEHALDNVIALGWETYEEDYENGEEERLVFHFGEDLKSVNDKLYARDIILKFDKTFEYVK